MNYLFILHEVCVFLIVIIGIIMSVIAKHLSTKLKVEEEINTNLQERHTKVIDELAKIRLEKEKLQAEIAELNLKIEKSSEKKPAVIKAKANKPTTKKKEETVKATRTRKTKKTE